MSGRDCLQLPIKSSGVLHPNQHNKGQSQRSKHRDLITSQQSQLQHQRPTTSNANIARGMTPMVNLARNRPASGPVARPLPLQPASILVAGAGQLNRLGGGQADKPDAARAAQTGGVGAKVGPAMMKRPVTSASSKAGRAGIMKPPRTSGGQAGQDEGHAIDGAGARRQGQGLQGTADYSPWDRARPALDTVTCWIHV
jgi:hypothetical protein